MNTLLRLGFWCLCLTAFSMQVMGQQTWELTGTVTDAETGEAVPYASVGIPQQQIGISSNYNGYFTLILKGIDPNHSIEISSIGFEKMVIKLEDIDFTRPLEVKLIPRATLLSEVVITGKTQTLNDLLKDVSKGRKTMLRSKPYLMNALYRETLSQQARYMGFTEAQGLFYVNGYNARYKNNKNQVMTYDLAQWKHIRRSDYPNPQYIRIGKLLKAKDFYLHDGPLARKSLDKFNFVVSDTSQYQGDPVITVQFTPVDQGSATHGYSGYFIVSQEDNALLELNIQQTKPSPFLKKTPQEDEQGSSFYISFFKFNGEYYLGRCTFQQTTAQSDVVHNHHMEIQSGMFAQQEARYMSEAQRAVLYSEMLNPIVHYDSSFWSSFKMAESEVLNKVMDQHHNLRQQFKDNSEQRLLPLPPGVESYEQMVDEQNFLDFFMQY